MTTLGIVVGCVAVVVIIVLTIAGMLLWRRKRRIIEKIHSEMEAQATQERQKEQQMVELEVRE